MKLYYYCSYTCSPAGFQKRCFDQATGKRIEISQENADDALITKFFMHGGAHSAFGKLPDGKYYFLLKNMNKENKNVLSGTLGQKWYINFAVSAEEHELEHFCRFVYEAYTDYETFADALYSTLSIGDETDSFHVDVEKFRQAFDVSEEKALVSDTQTKHFPYGLSIQQFSQVLNLLQDKAVTKLFEFVIYSAGEDYFYQNCGISPAETVHYSVSLGENTDSRQNSFRVPFKKPEEDHSLLIPIVAGTMTFAAVMMLTHEREKKKRRKKK